LPQQFFEAGLGALADYEMLEILPFQGVPRATPPIAKALIDIKGMGEAGAVMFRAVADAAERLAREG